MQVTILRFTTAWACNLCNVPTIRSFEKGLADRGGCREEILPMPEIEASFQYPFPMPPRKRGTHYWRIFGMFVGLCMSPTPSRQPLFETSETNPHVLRMVRGGSSSYALLCIVHYLLSILMRRCDVLQDEAPWWPKSWVHLTLLGAMQHFLRSNCVCVCVCVCVQPPFVSIWC